MVGLCGLRLAATRPHLQAYLCLAERWVQQMRKEAGRIAAVEIQRKVRAGGRAEGWLSATPLMAVCAQITRIYCYVPVVSLQYLGPIILTLHCALLLKTLGESPPGSAAGLRAGDMGTDPPPPGYRPLCPTGHHSWGLYPESPSIPMAVAATASHPGGEDEEDVRAAVEQITGVLGGILTPLFFRGLFAFLTWWVAACQVVTSLFGLYFHQHLAVS